MIYSAKGSETNEKQRKKSIASDTLATNKPLKFLSFKSKGVPVTLKLCGGSFVTIRNVV
jgi:hypothetical protein